jgi:hypothetical protein
MDYLLQKNPGLGIETQLKASLEKIGPTIMFRPFESDDLQTTLAGTLSEFPNKPVNLMIDLCNKDLLDWDKPLLSMICGRFVAGQALPGGSSIILLTDAEQADLDYSLSSPIRARVVHVDLKTSREEAFNSIQTVCEMISSERGQEVKAPSNEGVEYKSSF